MQKAKVRESLRTHTAFSEPLLFVEISSRSVYQGKNYYPQAKPQYYKA